MTWMRRLAGTMVGGLAVATGAAVFAGQATWFNLANHLLLQIAYATAAVLVVSILWRWWRWAGAAALLLIAQAAVVLPASTWRHPGTTANARESAATLRVVGFNLWVRNRAIADSIAFLRQASADVVVLSEVTPAWRAALEGLADTYPYRVDCARNGRCGLALLSRRPWLSARAWQDPDGIPLVEARIIVDDRVVTVVGTHLARPFPGWEHDGQQGQAAFMGRFLAAIEGPRVLVGDLNAAPWSPLVRSLAEQAGMVPLPGIDGTWPADLPQPLRVPIDQILVSREFGVPAREVGPNAGSDHRPVIADIPLPAE